MTVRLFKAMMCMTNDWKLKKTDHWLYIFFSKNWAYRGYGNLRQTFDLFDPCLIIITIIIIIIIIGSYNARLIYPFGYSRRRCVATAALIRQPQTHHHNEEPEIRNRILWEGVRFLGVGGNRSAPRKPTKAGMKSANQNHKQPLASCIGERKV